MKVTYLEDGVRKTITTDRFVSSEDGSVTFEWDDVIDDYNKLQKRYLVTLPHVLIEKVE